MDTGSPKDSSIVTLKISIPNARKALKSFASNRRKALDHLTQEVQNTVSQALNDLMNAEIGFFLGQSTQDKNKRNGYRTRTYALKSIGEIEVSIPRDRKGQFESHVVPKYERIDPRLKQDMAAIHLAGISNRTLAMLSKRLLGLNVSKDTVHSSLGLVKQESEKWLTRQLTDKYWALYLDGTHFNIQRRGSTEKEPMLVVLGVTEENYRSILAIEPGTRENVESWKATFTSLKQRGLDAQAVRIGIMDGLPGLERLFINEFSNAVSARCWVHAMRNACAKTPARLRDSFKLLAKKIMYAESEDDARKAFGNLKLAMHQDAGRAVSCIEKDLDSLVAHYRFDKNLWTSLKTTNAVERVHKEVKRRTKAMETVGETSLTSILAFTALRLEWGWRHSRLDSKALQNLRQFSGLKDSDDNPIEAANDGLSLVN